MRPTLARFGEGDRAEIRACAKHAALAPQDDDPNVEARRQSVEIGAHFGDHLGRHGVERSRAVQRQDFDGAPPLELQRGKVIVSPRPRSDRRVVLHFGVSAVALADAALDNPVADLVAVGHFDHVIAERPGELAPRSVLERPEVVLGIELASVVAMRPSLEASVEAALEEIACGKKRVFSNVASSRLKTGWRTRRWHQSAQANPWPRRPRARRLRAGGSPSRAFRSRSLLHPKYRWRPRERAP
jgi:hypothetical protein